MTSLTKPTPTEHVVQGKQPRIITNTLSPLQLASFKAELDNYSAQLNKVQLEVEKERTERANELSRLPKQIESNMLPISQLLDAMEQENSFFKNLPKREESRCVLVRGIKKMGSFVCGLFHPLFVFCLYFSSYI